MHALEEARLVEAFEKIAGGLVSIATIMQKRLDKEHPERPVVREAHVTHVKTTEEKLELEQQGEDDEEWGQRERDFLAQTRNKSGSST